ncbi:hypothetical protein DFJ74DRAFT_505029 [Hyaloraphidium curvatum]|nr:hypothetical protein DFJ74DRAFT_505029 [Hyaloraphidium curvatum]
MAAGGETILTLIKADHRGFLRLAQQLENDVVDKDLRQRILNTFIREVAVHSTLEEACVYPMITTKMGQEVSNQMRAEHQVRCGTLWLCARRPDTRSSLAEQPVKDKLYEVDQIGYVTDPKIAPLIKDVVDHLKTHIKHEEEQEIPRLESLLSASEMQTLVNTWHTMRPTIPTRPHPSAPASAPGNIMASAVATPLDKMKDLVRSYIDVDKS